MDAYGPNDEYPDDPDFECNKCGCCFDRPLFVYKDEDAECPECGSPDVHGGGYYG